MYSIYYMLNKYLANELGIKEEIIEPLFRD